MQPKTRATHVRFVGYYNLDYIAVAIVYTTV